MEYIVTADEMKTYDNNTIHTFGIDSMVLMERAALTVVDRILSLSKQGNVLILCGAGNNGGDGFAIARILHTKGYHVHVLFIGKTESMSDQCALQYQSALRYKIQVTQLLPAEESDRIFADTNALAQDTYDYIIDAIFGVSLNREVGGNYARVIDHVNQMHAYKIAVDIPSGIHADTGLVMGSAFLADETVTFAYKKAGLLLGVAKKYCGRIESVDIGITKESFQGRIPGQFSYQREDIQRIIPKRSLLSNKGSFGKVLLIAGCREIGGACILSAKSLYRSGCGYVRVLTHEANRDLLLSQVPEAVLTTYNDTALDIRAIKSAFDFATVIVIGPGLGEGEMARELLRYALMETQLPMVIDADAINLISKNPVLRDALLEHAKIRDVILTPHPLELQRFSGLDIANIRSRLLDAGREIADKLHVVLVCKNAATVVFDGRRARHLPDTYINQSGNDGLATAGSGDVLSGIIGALLAGGLDAMKSASMGVYLHGLCADLAAEDGSKSYLNAGDLTDFLKFLLE